MAESTATCIIKDCTQEGTHRAVIDLGAYLDAHTLMASSARRQKVWLCDHHNAVVASGSLPFLSIDGPRNRTEELNVIATALSKSFGWLPLSVRYGVARRAFDELEAQGYPEGGWH